MSLKDLLGNTLAVGDLISIKQEHIVGIVVKIENGTIAKGISVGAQPRGEMLPEHLIVKIEFTTMIPAVGGGPANVLKIVAPQTEKGLIQ